MLRSRYGDVQLRQTEDDFLLLQRLQDGGKYTITASLLPSKVAFEEVYELLAAKVRE